MPTVTDPDLQSVDLDDADRARIEYLSTGDTAFDRSEAERIVRFGKLPRSARKPSMLSGDCERSQTASDGTSHASASGSDQSPSAVEADDCADIRRRMRQARRPSTVMDRYDTVHPSAVFRHAEGRCNHDHDEPPTTSPRVGVDECCDIRDAFRAGATKADIMADFHRSANAVHKHLWGRCDHDCRRDDPVDAVLSTAECGHLRHAYRRNETVTVDECASAYRIAVSTAYKHLRDDCDHDVDVDPIPRASTTTALCDELRQSHSRRDDPVVARIAREFGVTRPTADYHIFGRCRCDGDVQPQTRDEH